MIKGVTGQNVDNPKRRWLKRRQTKMPIDQNVDKPKRRQTETSTNQNVDKPKRRHFILVNCMPIYLFLGMHCIHQYP